MNSNDALADADLRKVQARREWPVKVTQRIQIAIQDSIISSALNSEEPLHVPLALQALARFAFLRRIPARVIGMGVRPEHVRSAAAP